MTEIPSKSEVSTVSEKEINDLIQTGELAKQDIDDELMKAAEAHAEAQVADLEEEKRKRKKTLIKLGAMLTLTVLILVFTTMHMTIK